MLLFAEIRAVGSSPSCLTVPQPPLCFVPFFSAPREKHHFVGSEHNEGFGLILLLKCGIWSESCVLGQISGSSGDALVPSAGI